MSQANALRSWLDSHECQFLSSQQSRVKSCCSFCYFLPLAQQLQAIKRMTVLGNAEPVCCMRVSGFLISFCLSLVQCSIYFPINHVKKAIFKVKDGVLETQQHCGCVCCNEGLMKAQCVCVYRRGHFVHCPSGCFLRVYNVSMHLYDARFASFCLHVVGRGRISCWLLHQCLFCCNKA